MRINDYEVCNDISYLFDSKIVLYGTGYWGNMAYEYLNKMQIDIFQACNTSAGDKDFYGHRVLSLAEIKEKYDSDRVLLLISSDVYYKEMIEEIEKLDFERIKVCTLYAFFMSSWIHSEDERIPEHIQKQLRAKLGLGRQRSITDQKNRTLEFLLMATDITSDVILIYQPGKVGSQSIRQFMKGPSIHLHSLVVPFSCEMYDTELLDIYIDKLRHKKKIKIITGVREPISRDISAFFQSSDDGEFLISYLNKHVFWLYGDYYENREKLTEKEFYDRHPIWSGDLNQSFAKIQKNIVKKRLDVFSWFDYEVKRIFHVDIYEYPFDRENGYSIIKKDNVEILLYKQEKLSELEAVISQFIEDDTYKLGGINKGGEKKYAYTYKEFKQNVALEQEYFNYYYNGNKKLEHFYTPEEIKSFHDFWEKRIRKNISS